MGLVCGGSICSLLNLFASQFLDLRLHSSGYHFLKPLEGIVPLDLELVPEILDEGICTTVYVLLLLQVQDSPPRRRCHPASIPTSLLFTSLSCTSAFRGLVFPIHIRCLLRCCAVWTCRWSLVNIYIDTSRAELPEERKAHRNGFKRSSQFV